MLYGCGAGYKRFKEQYPDRPTPGNERTILQSFVGKPASSLVPYLGQPDDQRLGIRVWREEKYITTKFNTSNIGSDGGTISNLDKCQVVAKTDASDIIMSIRYEKDIKKSNSVTCPAIGNLNKLKYMVNTALYEFDKKHGIVNSSYYIPN